MAVQPEDVARILIGFLLTSDPRAISALNGTLEPRGRRQGPGPPPGEARTRPQRSGTRRATRARRQRRKATRVWPASGHDHSRTVSAPSGSHLRFRGWFVCFTSRCGPPGPCPRSSGVDPRRPFRLRGHFVGSSPLSQNVYLAVRWFCEVPQQKSPASRYASD